MTELHILEDHQAEAICGGLTIIPVSIDFTKTITKVSYDLDNKATFNVGAKVLTKGAILAASINNTQVNMVG